MKNSYIIEYLNENEFRKKERAVKNTICWLIKS